MCIRILAVALLAGLPATAQSGHRLITNGNRFVLEDRATAVKRPFEMWTTRLANAFVTQSFADRVIAALDDYVRYGVNTVCISVQGGELGPGANTLYPKTLNADGTLDLASPVWARLDRFLDETDRRGIAVNVMIWYHRRAIEVPDDTNALAATRAVAAWLRATGHEHYFYDVANEFDHNAYRFPDNGPKRPLFSTLQGALALVHAVQQVDPGRPVGVSPLGQLFCPNGTLLAEPGQPFVDADVIYNHGWAVDPLNLPAYRFGVWPADPRTKPLVNNEFFTQLGYELRPYLNPRTNLLSYGHWDAFTIQRYVGELAAVRGFDGAPNVFSHFQQYARPFGAEPEAEVGPAGTQPESTLTPNEPSLHWMFDAIAGLRGFAGLPFFLDMDAHTGGLETALAGTWSIGGGELAQTDGNASPAWARIGADDGELEVAFDARWLAAPGAGYAGIRVGDETPAGDAWAADVLRDRLRVARGATMTTLAHAPRATSRYAFRMRRGRVQLDVDGVTAIDVAGAPVGADQNLLLVTGGAAAAFDNVRLTPFRDTDFEDGTSGAWQVQSGAWSVVPRPGVPAERVWASTAAGLAADARLFGDVRVDARVDVAAATGALGLRWRAADATDASSDGYTLFVAPSGDVRLERTRASVATTLATARVTITPADVAITVVAEGARHAVRIDGATVFDVIDPAPDAPRRGALQLVTPSGTTRVDDVFVALGPDRLPEARYTPAAGPAFAKGSTFEFTDPDGVNDVAFLAFALAPGTQTFVDLTVLMHPAFNLFTFLPTADGRGYRFRSLVDVPVTNGPWRIRLTTRDCAGQTAVRIFSIG